MSFVVLEFDDKIKNCSVVPIVWLTESNRKCFWPRNVKADVFESLVQNCAPPALNWKSHDVKKIFNTFRKVVATNCRYSNTANVT